jgi:hypothetical protein
MNRADAPMSIDDVVGRPMLLPRAREWLACEPTSGCTRWRAILAHPYTFSRSTSTHSSFLPPSPAPHLALFRRILHPSPFRPRPRPFRSRSVPAHRARYVTYGTSTARALPQARVRDFYTSSWSNSLQRRQSVKNQYNLGSYIYTASRVKFNWG